MNIYGHRYLNSFTLKLGFFYLDQTELTRLRYLSVLMNGGDMRKKETTYFLDQCKHENGASWKDFFLLCAVIAQMKCSR